MIFETFHHLQLLVFRLQQQPLPRFVLAPFVKLSQLRLRHFLFYHPTSLSYHCTHSLYPCFYFAFPPRGTGDLEK